MADLCIHEMDPRWCATCKHGPAKPEPVTIVATFRARFDGECPECERPIVAGVCVIHKLSNDTYVHQSCH